VKKQIINLASKAISGPYVKLAIYMKAFLNQRNINALNVLILKNLI